MKKQQQSPYKLYTPAIREPLPLRRKPYILPVPPEMPDKPQKINWLRTLLPPFIMLAVLFIVSTLVNTGGFIFYTMMMMGIYPIARVVGYKIENNIFEKKEVERKAKYDIALANADTEIKAHITRQRELLQGEFLPTEQVIKLAKTKGKHQRLWYRTDAAVDFLGLRIGIFDGAPTFPILVPKDVDEVDLKDPLLKDAKKLKANFQILRRIPYLLELKKMGSVAILGPNNLRYGLAHHLLLDILVHHRPDEVEVYMLSTHSNANKLWGWLRWLPHAKVFDDDKEFNHLLFGTQAIKIFLGRFESYLKKNKHKAHQVFIIDVDGFQQYDDDFIQELLAKTITWNISFLFVGGNQLPRSVRGVIHIKEQGKKAIFVDTRVDTEDIEEKEYHTHIKLDRFPSIEECETVARSLAGIKLLGSSGGELLRSNVSLFDVLDLGEDDKLTHDDVRRNWAYGVDQGPRNFDDEELLQFPLGLQEESGKLLPFELNLLDANLKGKDAYHTILIGTTGSGKSEFIKSLILGSAYKYPPQYLNFFCMDFKGGSTIDQLEKLPHVIGVMTNLDEVLAQRGLVAVAHEIDRRQAEFKEAGKKDIWEYNNGIDLENRMPHLVLVLDEFTRGLDMLNDPEFSLQDLLEKRLVNQGRSLGIYLVLANQVANAKAMKLMPNIGWKIALRVASKDQMSFIDSSLKPPKYAGRGYVQAMGEDPVEFQSGYSGDYVKYSDMRIKQTNIAIKELLPNGDTLTIKEAEKVTDDEVKDNKYLEMNQLISAIQITQKNLNIPNAKKIYLPPMPRRIDLSYPALDFKNKTYRSFSKSGWSEQKEENFLKVPAGLVDLTEQCRQEPLIIDFKEKTPHLLLVGSQSDLNDGVRSILFSLLSTHSPDDLNIYMLEFGQGLRDIPSYPHVGDIILEKETEKIARTIELFENEFRKREEISRSEKAVDIKLPDWFLIINNLAGLGNNPNWYARIIQLIIKESHKYGIHIIALTLPKGTGTRVPVTDLKNFKSRIVFPSVIHENYWMYLEIPERKLAKLTNMDMQFEKNEDAPVSRAYWLNEGDSNFGKLPLEIQLALPKYDKILNEEILSLARQEERYDLPVAIEVLREVYPLPSNFLQGEMYIGVKWLDLKELSIPFDKLPPIWGVSGPRKSGKTGFLTSFLHQTSLRKKEYEIDIFSGSRNQLTDYSESNKFNTFFDPEKILERFKEIVNENFDDRKIHRLLIFDDINFLWERKDDVNDEIIHSLKTLADKMYRKKDMVFVASFNSDLTRMTMLRDNLMREFVNNKTGLCLGYEGDWLIRNTDLPKYTKKFKGAIPAGRGVFALNGDEIEVQAFLFEERE
jgi:DNA segregation ATPase FtsK/SpoIIIE, S-DNA-T family